MLYPQTNPYRQAVDLSGLWDLKFDPEGHGERQGWAAGFPDGRPSAVPASWNDQYLEWRDYFGQAWYQTQFDLPWGWDGMRVFVRFNSVNYLAEVWLNGQRLGQHEGGHLPFEFDVTGDLKEASNRLVVRVDGALAPDRMPPGEVPPDPKDSFNRPFPAANFDFFPFCGIHRPVILYAVPAARICDLRVTTGLRGEDGLVRVQVQTSPLGEAANAAVRLTLEGHGFSGQAEAGLHGEAAEIELVVPQAALWAPGAPNLYTATLELLVDGGPVDGGPVDRYSLPVGIRTIEVQGDGLLLNGQPVVLRGFGRHEDFPINGRGLNLAVVVKDYALLEWIGANSFRTTHYPYSEQMMDLADRLGFLVIDETPVVGMYFDEAGLERRQELCAQMVAELIDRDKNHPSVIAWSLANEPHSHRPAAAPTFRGLYDLAKSLDPTRPVTLVSYLGVKEEAFEFLDLVCLNRYYGWYTEYGDITAGLANLAAEVDAVHGRYPKPFLLTEFGADTIPGAHAEPAEMFTEEYQAELLAGYIRVLESKPFVAGMHVWNMCDFKTGQITHRFAGMNMKGVFTRDRRPKMAAHTLRRLWRRAAEPGT